MPLPTRATVRLLFFGGVYSMTSRRGAIVAVRPTPWMPPMPCFRRSSPTIDVTLTPLMPLSAARLLLEVGGLHLLRRRVHETAREADRVDRQLRFERRREHLAV